MDVEKKTTCFSKIPDHRGEFMRPYSQSPLSLEAIVGCILIVFVAPLVFCLLVALAGRSTLMD